MASRDWSWVHYKILDLSDGSRLPELLEEHRFFGFPGGDTRIRESALEETRGALLDLLAVGAVDVFDDDGKLSRERALQLVRDDSSWSFALRGSDLEIVENERTGQFIAQRPLDRDPHVSLGKRR
jgi:hypothetical protein